MFGTCSANFLTCWWCFFLLGHTSAQWLALSDTANILIVLLSFYKTLLNGPHGMGAVSGMQSWDTATTGPRTRLETEQWKMEGSALPALWRLGMGRWIHKAGFMIMMAKILTCLVIPRSSFYLLLHVDVKWYVPSWCRCAWAAAIISSQPICRAHNSNGPAPPKALNQRNNNNKTALLFDASWLCGIAACIAWHRSRQARLLFCNHCLMIGCVVMLSLA